jgi:hypothetical protein
MVARANEEIRWPDRIRLTGRLIRTRGQAIVDPTDNVFTLALLNRR